MDPGHASRGLWGHTLGRCSSWDEKLISEQAKMLFFLLDFSGRHSSEVFDKVLSFVLFFPPFLSSREEERKEVAELKLGE